jgi:OOP family OmpA-OmpF porin
MNKLYSIFLLLGLAVFAGSASAANNGWYVGVDLGQSNYAQIQPNVTELSQTLTDEGFPNTPSSNNTPTAWDLDVGYQFDRYFAVEGGYTDFGSATADINSTTVPVSEHIDIHAKGETLFAVGILPVSDSFSFFGKLGLLAYSQDFTGNVSGTGIPTQVLPNSSDSGTTPAIGVGANWDINNRFGLRLGFTRFHAVGNANNTGEGTIDFSYLGLVVHF